MAFAQTVIISCNPGTLPGIVSELQSVAECHGPIGCWITEIGILNRIVMMRFADDLAVFDTPIAGLPGFDSGVVSVETTRWRVHGDVASAASLVSGNQYEWREYDLVPGRGGELISVLQAALPPRHALSPLLALMTSLDGAQRVCHIWPYASLAERARIRRESAEAGIWPPKGIAHCLGKMCNAIMTPTAFSAYR